MAKILKGKHVYNWDSLPVTLSVHDVALILDMHPTTVNQKCREGALPAQKVGRTWYIKRDKLRELLGQDEPSYTSAPDQIEIIAQRVASIVIEALKGAY